MISDMKNAKCVVVHRVSSKKLQLFETVSRIVFCLLSYPGPFQHVLVRHKLFVSLLKF